MAKNTSNIRILYPALLIVGIILVNFLLNGIHLRWDLTGNKRYTLSEASKGSVLSIQEPITIDVFLKGDLPAEFRKLQQETEQILSEFAAVNPRLKYHFIDPMDNDEEREANLRMLQQLGLTPASVTIEEGSRVSQELVFPWALANVGEQTVRIPLLKNILGASNEERINSSVQELEYAFADAFTKLGLTDKKKIAVLKGNGELEDLQIADFLSSLKEYYQIAPFTLDSVANTPERTLNQLKTFDLVIVAKPSEAFSDSEKLVLDQYTLNGGKSLWMVDQVAISMDSIFKNEGKSIAMPMDLNLNDMFFKYGVRINPALINDLYFTQIVLATGSGNNSQYNPVPWLYAPMVRSSNDHAINNNIEAVRMQFVNPIDTLQNGIKKTVLLRSSPLSKPVGTPVEVDLEMVTQQPDQNTYTKGNMPVAVLLEGNFTSVFNNRILPFKTSNYKNEGIETKMIVISDGDIIRNDLQNGRPLELGYDKWTNNFYGNKEFLLNCVNYMLEENGLINIRNKKIALAFLDQQRIVEDKNYWQLVNIGVPVVLILIFAGVFNGIRRRNYNR
ncbi:gliding motility-associated ABC transporter substrate-binding protein GldG [Robertkochia solimangrovi]|uniref:gliding motility-associated ABC transporter substrate-binding protein GldG n=1 Tax=Robertkochia solimangrovi TaxID=2213046 RepID=UPI00117D3EBB|nr:gliding motility-associated ABC transporter substrate-binding protein GldG [Robertkochia solimangrovi]TRZ45144.1 gliding motility-associated ABC transporter substrate-binding protein GldG [Robertkochia solimangrovi]